MNEASIQMDTIPTPMLYKIKKLSGLSKQTLRIIPSSGQASVSAGQKIIIQLPSNTLLDLSTCILNFYGTTTHLGGKQDALQMRFFPRNIASIVENLEVKMGGQSIQNISQYGYLYNLMYDITQGKDGESRRKIGENADPSYSVSPAGVRNVGYCAAGATTTNVLNTDALINDQARNAAYYSIRSWLGFLGGNCSTNVIDTGMTGQIDIEITLAPASCLMNGSSYNILGSLGSGSAVASETANYTLSDISLSVVKYDMPSWYYDSINANLEAGAVYPIYYPNYSSFSGASTTDKSTSLRFSVSTTSLDMVIGTFQADGRTTASTPLNSTLSGVVPAAATPFSGAEGNTASQLVNRGAAQSFNNSKYFQRDGNGVSTSTFTIGHVRLNPANMIEQYNNTLTAFGVQNDTLGGISPLIQSLYHFKDTFYCDVLSTKFVGDNDGIYSVSGLDSKEQVITIGWDVVGGASGATSGTPIAFACYSSSVNISGNRFITPQA